MRRVADAPLLLAGNTEAEIDRLAELLEVARKNPAAALKQLNDFKEDGLLEEGFKAIAMGWAQTAPTACAGWVSSIPDSDLQAGAALGLSAVWAAKDGSATLTWLQALPVGRARDMALIETAVGWANTDVGPALEAYLFLPREAALDQALDELLWRAIDKQPASTMARLERLESPRRDLLIEAALISRSIEKPEDSFKQAVRIQDTEAVLRVRQNSLAKIAESDPARAIQLFTEAGAPAALVPPIVVSWFETDSAAAMDWINTLPTEAHKTAARRALLPPEPVPAQTGIGRGAVESAQPREVGVR